MRTIILFRAILLAATILFISIANAQSVESITSIQKSLSELETQSGGRLGLSAINTANNTTIQYRADERFAFCSTSKVMVIGAILKESEKNPDLLQEKITYTQSDVDKSGYAVITKKHIIDGMGVSELAQAAIEYSDNTAINLLIKLLGGPEAINNYARSMGDHAFRLDRWEPELNTAIPNDPRDTTTPRAMVNSLRQLAIGEALASPPQILLQTWLKSNTTGNQRIRAGIPKDWIVDDKTGTGSYGTANDIAVIWPPKCAPIVMVVYLTQKEKNAPRQEAVIASAARLTINEFAKSDQCIRDSIQ